MVAVSTGNRRVTRRVQAEQSRRVDCVLAWCARPTVDGVARGELAKSLEGFDDWQEFLARAEAHGVGPLVYYHLNAAGISVPGPALRALQGTYLRHRQAMRLRVRALVQIISALDRAGIESRVLKGAALAHLTYAEPGLRPMGDVDILMKSTQIRQAQAVLATMGFASPSSDNGTLPDKHVVVVGFIDGFPIKVELHHDLFQQRRSIRTSTESLMASRRPFTLGEFPVYTLRNEIMLWHLCQHLVVHADVFTRLRLIWIADIVGFAERFAREIDWEEVRGEWSIVQAVLSLIDTVTPLSEDLRKTVGVRAVRTTTETWGDFAGWPRTSVAAQRLGGKSWAKILRDTLFPPGWWLRLHYGLDSSHPLALHRWARHPLEILSWTTHLLRERAKADVVGG
jgi:hypothetical protein